ncbi:MAG: twin-arginine translocase subunit TatB [Candidatus Parabeggiatoa sp. nov. 2]|nr:MAG: twin-arginine translocase subunit TatB [Gammaproteobacteria bacterium]HEC84194.1 twin-arginine translocase subunit TatB [Thioploca sp.]
MFDIGFWELGLIAVVALLVFGPEKLPGAARTAGLWVGRARRFVTTVKQDIDREIELQEIRDNIKESDQNVHQFFEEAKTGLNKLKKPISLDPSQLTGNKSDSSSSNTSTATANTKL